MSSSHFLHPQCTASLETGHNVLNTKRFDALATTQGIRAPDRLDFLTSGASQIFKRLRPLCLSTRRRPPGPRRRRATDRQKRQPGHRHGATAHGLHERPHGREPAHRHRPAALRPAEPFARAPSTPPGAARGPQHQRRQQPDQRPGLARADHLGPPLGHQHPSQPARLGPEPLAPERQLHAVPEQRHLQQGGDGRPAAPEGQRELGPRHARRVLHDPEINDALGNYFTEAEVTANLVNAYTDTQLLNYSDAAAMNQAIADADRGLRRTNVLQDLICPSTGRRPRRWRSSPESWCSTGTKAKYPASWRENWPTTRPAAK